MLSTVSSERILVIGEVLWDLFEGEARLGGAPLNFAVHASRMGHEIFLVSAVGDDQLGVTARDRMEALGIDTRFVRTTPAYPTGTASVRLHGGGQASFRIPRPTAFDAIDLSDQQLTSLVEWRPGWIYYGTLAHVSEPSRHLLRRVMEALPRAVRFHDINLRPGCYSAEVVTELASAAEVVKLNEMEMQTVADLSGLGQSDPRTFCRMASERFGWRVICITLGSRGCIIWRDGEYLEAEGNEVQVADTVGAGDAYAAAILHGLSQDWQTAEVAAFANRVGATIASRPGGIPDWDLREVMTEIR